MNDNKFYLPPRIEFCLDSYDFENLDLDQVKTLLFKALKVLDLEAFKITDEYSNIYLEVRKRK